MHAMVRPPNRVWNLAGRPFLEPYHPILDVIQNKLQQLDTERFLVAHDPICNIDVNVSLSSYADDVAGKLCGKTPQELANQSVSITKCIDSEFAQIGLGQNRDKQEHAPFFVKAWAHGHYRSMFCDNLLAGKVCRQARYLDPPCTFNGSQNGLWQQNLVGWLVGASGHDCLVVIKETLHFSWYGLHSRITGRVGNLCFGQICASRVRQVR
jgi:hypothetical protein